MLPWSHLLAVGCNELRPQTEEYTRGRSSRLVKHQSAIDFSQGLENPEAAAEALESFLRRPALIRPLKTRCPKT